ncbi:Lactose regulatory protein LAC9 [Talaromyces islandicus]|uniref:Lactose regulatory protein LAC9 n=1 Tax=Talaromyces islandicus TaxID=28573 RepID=A0A0U1M2T1_TALIS|nr:Lactose regulatory protein LAC9 [Talaromyces islandicus]
MADKPLAANSRKYHHKTRRGCVACKQRRIKCDEKKPVCTNCSKKSIECSFVHLVPASILRKLQFQRSQPDGLTIQQPTDLRAGLFCRPDSFDFALFNRYISHTSHMISQRQNGMEIYTSVIPKLALLNPSLGHAVLATAYGHLARSMPQTEMAAKYLTDSAFHMNTTLACYSQAISSLSKENTPTVFANSVLISLYVFLSSGIEYEEILSRLSLANNRDPNLLDHLLCIAVRMIHGTRGVFSVFWSTQEWIATSHLSPLIQRHNPIRDTAPHLFWAQIEDQHLANLQNLWERDASVSSHRSYILSQSLHSLRHTFSLTTRLYVFPPETDERYSSVEPISLKEIHQVLCGGMLDDLPSVFTWYIRASAPFVSMLGQGDPFAVVIWAHHAILLDRACGKNWWFCDLASKFISAALLILGEERRSWIEWPLSVAGSGSRLAVEKTQSID